MKVAALVGVAVLFASAHAARDHPQTLLGPGGTRNDLPPVPPFPPAPPAGGAPHWALIIAGSAGWGNYRHQADICHAYQVLISAGVPADHIVTMMADDLAQNSENPHPGVLINNPQAKDVYGGVAIDYKGSDVNAANFLAVLAGDATKVSGGNGRVIDSAATDNVFVYFADHGGPGILGMPTAPYLYAKDLIDTLKAKAAAKAFNQLTFYVEACESGSIFDGLLPDDINVYVVTAANPTESSWGYYCPGMTPAPPSEYNTCLGDLFSISFLENCDASDLKTETLDAQYTALKNRTSQGGTYSQGSHVMQYGTTTWTQETVSDFVGMDVGKGVGAVEHAVGEAVAQRDGDLLHLWTKYQRAADASEEKDAAWATLNAEIASRDAVASAIKGVAASVLAQSNSLETAEQLMTAMPPAGKPVVQDWQCYKAAVSAFEAECGALNQSAFKHFRAFANLCNRGIAPAVVGKHAKPVCQAAGLSA